MSAVVDREPVFAAYEDVRNDNSETSWACFQYSEDAKTIEFSKSGTDYAEMLENFTDDNRMYAFVRIMTGDEMSKRAKFVLVTWIGKNVSILKKAKVSTDKGFVKQICNNFAVEVLANEHNELSEDHLKDLCVKAGGAAYGVGVRD